MKEYFDDYDMTREDPASDLPGNADPADMESVNEEEPAAGNGNEGVPGGDAYVFLLHDTPLVTLL